MRWMVAGVAAVAVSAAAGAAVVGAAAEEPQARRESRAVVRMARPGGYLGVSLADVSSDEMKRLGLSEQRGAVVSEVVGDSPAAKAGLEKDDVIVGFDGENVRSAAHLSRLVHETPAGRSVPLAYLRGGARRQAQVTLAEGRGPRLLGDMGLPGLDNLKIEGLDKLKDRLDAFDLPEPPEPPEPPEAQTPGAPRAPVPPRPPRGPFAFDFPEFGFRPRLGIEAVDLTDQLARYFKVEDGVLVSSVREGSPAEKAGLHAGDIILKVDGEPVGTSRELVRRISRGDDAREVTLSIQRDGRPMDVRVRLEPRRRPQGPTT